MTENITNTAVRNTKHYFSFHIFLKNISMMPHFSHHLLPLLREMKAVRKILHLWKAHLKLKKMHYIIFIQNAFVNIVTSLFFYLLFSIKYSVICGKNIMNKISLKHISPCRKELGSQLIFPLQYLCVCKWRYIFKLL